MPSSVVHLFVAQMLADKLKIKNLPQFFVGAISPDAVNLNGFADEKTRYDAHIRTKDVSEWLQNVSEFYRSKTLDYRNECDFLKGFVVHLLTDIAWDISVQPRLFRGLEFIGVEKENLREEKWQELYRFNGQLMSLENWQFIKGELKKSHPVAVTTVSAELLGDFLKNLLSDDYQKVSLEPPFVLKITDIETTASKVSELWENLQ